MEIHGIRAVVTDIEGTTSSLTFVKEVLFPYARRLLPAFVVDHGAELGNIAVEIEAITGKSGLSTQEMIGVLLQWMDEDRKVTPLKTLQGLIWQTGFETGELQGHIYEDAVRALRKWHADGLRIYVYSSGSVTAQKLLFSHTSYGDLLPLFSGYFDTTTGAKLESHSYVKIADVLHLPASSIVFLSDHTAETQAAAAAGMQTVLLMREQTSVASVGAATDRFAHSFDDIALFG
jgi:enolase-phosphatase E1